MKDFPGLIVIVKNRMRKHHGINICKNLHYNIKGDWKIIRYEDEELSTTVT